uniref:Uncharacterized protein n=1 Tax=Lepeophtheirus salmonis TaxID=72036 RepID=A0A0K2SVY9_LEPSM
MFTTSTGASDGLLECYFAGVTGCPLWGLLSDPKTVFHDAADQGKYLSTKILMQNLCMTFRTACR